MYIDWIPIFVAALSIAGAAATYAYQRKVDRKASLIENRRTLYRDFIISIVDVAESVNGVAEIKVFRKKLVEVHLFGSDEVIRATDNFTCLYRTENPSSADKIEKFALLEAAMRRDCYESTDIGPEELQAMLPVKF